MARTPGAYKLGKAILDNLGDLHDKVETSESGGIATNSWANYMLVRDALLHAARDANFTMLELALMTLLPPITQVAESEVIA